MLSKPRGGFRPIALLPGVYRVIKRARSPVVRAWLIQHDRPFYTCVAGRCPENTVWRQSARAEAAARSGGFAGSFLTDGHKFYESFDLRRLFSEAWYLKFPMTVARLALHTYAGKRHLTGMGICLAGVHAECGLPAGCIDALAMVVVYTIRSFDQYVGRHPSIKFDTFVDDFVASSDSMSRQKVEDDLAAAAVDLAYVVNMELKGTLAKDKTGVVATDPLLAKGLAMRIKPSLGGQAGLAVANLGVDYAPGQARKRHCHSGKRLGRYKSLKARIQRAARIRSAAGPAASKLYYCGIKPAITYGSAVHGISPAEQHRLRVALLSCKAPQQGGPA